MSIDESQEVYRAREQIRNIVAEVESMSRGDMAEADFFSALLDRILQAMEGVAGLIWLARDGGRVEPVCHAGMQRTGLTDAAESQQPHGQLVQALMGSPGGLLVPPKAALEGQDGKVIATNPT